VSVTAYRYDLVQWYHCCGPAFDSIRQGGPDKHLCRCFGAPARRVFPDHLITCTLKKKKNKAIFFVRAFSPLGNLGSSHLISASQIAFASLCKMLAAIAVQSFTPPTRMASVSTRTGEVSMQAGSRRELLAQVGGAAFALAGVAQSASAKAGQFGKEEIFGFGSAPLPKLASACACTFEAHTPAVSGEHDACREEGGREAGAVMGAVGTGLSHRAAARRTGCVDLLSVPYPPPLGFPHNSPAAGC